MQTKRLKLDYTEITPGNLAEVLRVWDEILNCPDPSSRPSEATVLLNSVKIGVPRTKRGEVWQYLVEQHRHNNPSLAGLNPTRNQAVGYEDLLKQLTTHQHAILIDLGRCGLLNLGVHRLVDMGGHRVVDLGVHGCTYPWLSD